MKRMMGAAAAAIVGSIMAQHQTESVTANSGNMILSNPIPYVRESKNKRNPGNRKSFQRTRGRRSAGRVLGPPTVKNPAIASNMNAQHDAWYFKKFGTHPDPY